MKKKTIAGIILALFISVTSLTADVIDTPAGTMLFSTNTVLVFSNWANVLYTNYSTNNWSQVVDAIFGFTNAFGSNYQDGYTNYPSQEFFAQYNLLNEGNSNTLYSLSFRVEEITNYDGVEPDDISGWSLLVTNTNTDTTPLGPSSPLVPNTTTLRTTNIGEDGSLDFAVYIKSPVNAVNGTGYRIYITNSLTTNHGPYDGNNNYTYGGTNILVNTFEYIVKAPDMKVWKTISITNPSSAENAHAVDALVPGSMVTYTIHYTNKGDASALGLAFDEYLPNLDQGGGTRYVDFVIGSTVGTGETLSPGYDHANSIAASTDGGSTFGTTLGSLSANSGSVNTNIDAIRINFPADLGPKEGGSLSYSVIVR